MKKQPQPHKRIVFVCTNCRKPGDRVSCGRQGSEKLRDMLKEMVKERRLRGRVRVSQSGCLDRCEEGPNIMVFPDNIWYSHVSEEDLPAILREIEASLEAEGALPRDYEYETPS